jgi:tetraacyldisaccharide 4'-kinase
VLRGYGADEPLVHRRLNPGIPVVVSPDRLAGVAAAHAAGATVAVLDDAFQHRRVRRAVDLVLVSADRWSAHRRRLPAGPWRESLGALRRASMALVTVKAAEADAVDAALRAIAEAAPELPVGVARLALGEVGSVAGPPGAGRSTALDDLRGTNVLVVAAIADPAAFVRQLESAGATVRGTRKRYGDHHAFTDAEVTSLAAEATGTDAVVCTLKDAVKLEGRWPRGAPPLRFVSQRVIIERGQEAVDHLLMRVILSPPESHDAAGPDRPPLR